MFPTLLFPSFPTPKNGASFPPPPPPPGSNPSLPYIPWVSPVRRKGPFPNFFWGVPALFPPLSTPQNRRSSTSPPVPNLLPPLRHRLPILNPNPGISPTGGGWVSNFFFFFLEGGLRSFPSSSPPKNGVSLPSPRAPRLTSAAPRRGRGRGGSRGARGWLRGSRRTRGCGGVVAGASPGREAGAGPGTGRSRHPIPRRMRHWEKSGGKR